MTLAPAPAPTPPTGPAHPWRSRLSAAGAALSSALTHAPENAAYGLMAMAPLGAAFGPWAMGLAMLGAALACATASLVGGGRLVDDAGAALALLTTGLVATLLPMAPGTPAEAAGAVLVLVALAIAGGGLLTVLLGLLRVGGVVKFTPYPVRVGLSSGVGLLLIGSAAPTLLGQPFGGAWPAAAAAVPPGALAVGATALALTTAAALLRSRVPPVLVGLMAATGLPWVATLAGWSGPFGPTVGVPALPEQWLGGGLSAPGWRAALAQPGVPALLGSYALTVAVVASLDALLAASIVDGRLRQRRDANRELVAHGLANLASALVGGLPASPAVPASVGLVQACPDQRHVALAYAGALAAVLLLAPALLGLLPVAAVGGVLVYLGATMIAPTLWQTPLALWRERGTAGSARHRIDLAANGVVTAAVALSAVVLGLGPAVLIGATCAVLLFVRSNMREVVRRSWTGSTRHSLKTRPVRLAEVLRQQGGHIAVLELDGALFFGTADDLRGRLGALGAAVHTAILDLHQVRDLDLTAARILVETADDWQRQGKRLVLAEWPAGDPRRGLIESVAAADEGVALHWAASTDQALEQAEDELLQALQVGPHAGERLQLADTAIAAGLTPDELRLLAEGMNLHHFTRGQVMFRAGDAGDALYISLQGEIGLRLPGTHRRLASFAPGVTIGEMAVLARAPRSAEAYAESDVSALGMSTAAFEQLLQAHPAVAAKVMRNLALHLGDRVRGLTGDLAGWMSRSGAGRPADG